MKFCCLVIYFCDISKSHNGHIFVVVNLVTILKALDLTLFLIRFCNKNNGTENKASNKSSLLNCTVKTLDPSSHCKHGFDLVELVDKKITLQRTYWSHKDDVIEDFCILQYNNYSKKANICVEPEVVFW